MARTTDNKGHRRRTHTHTRLQTKHDSLKLCVRKIMLLCTHTRPLVARVCVVRAWQRCALITTHNLPDQSIDWNLSTFLRDNIISVSPRTIYRLHCKHRRCRVAAPGLQPAAPRAVVATTATAPLCRRLRAMSRATRRSSGQRGGSAVRHEIRHAPPSVPCARNVRAVSAGRARRRRVHAHAQSSRTRAPDDAPAIP